MKSSKPAWSDLIIEGLQPEQTLAWLSPWFWLVSGSVAPVFLSKFGDWFLRRPDGSTEMLDVVQGVLMPVAKTPEQFKALVNTKEWQDRNLLVVLVGELLAEGKIPGPGQCYAVSPHPRQGGRLEREYITVSDMLAWQTSCARIAREMPASEGSSS